MTGDFGLDRHEVDHIAPVTTSARDCILFDLTPELRQFRSRFYDPKAFADAAKTSMEVRRRGHTHLAAGKQDRRARCV